MIRKLLYGVALALSAAAPALADNWPCEVALCMSDPRGARTESACRPPVDRALREWARGRSVPACRTETGDIALRRIVIHWDDCPTGTRMTAGESRWAALGRFGTGTIPSIAQTPVLVAGAGFNASLYDTDIPRACVSGRSQDVFMTLNQDDTASTVTVYERLVLLPRQNKVRVELWLNGALLSTAKGL